MKVKALKFDILLWHLGTAASHGISLPLFHSGHLSLPVLSHKHHYIHYISAGGVESECVSVCVSVSVCGEEQKQLELIK